MVKEYYANQWHFFRKQLLPMFIILLLLSILMGYLTYHYCMDHPDKTKSRLYSTYQNAFEKSGLITKSGLKLMIEIFWANLLICLKSIILGFVPFLFLPAIGVFSSVMQIGLFLAGFKLFTEMDQFSLFVSLLPHGIFEIAASLYASSVGVYLTIQTSKMIFHKSRSKGVPIKALCKQAAHSFILIVVPLLIVAAFIEAFISSIPK